MLRGAPSAKMDRKGAVTCKSVKPERIEYMNRANEPTLSALLQEALKTVIITRRSSQDRLAPNNYRRRVLTYRNFHNPSLWLDTFMYEPQIQDRVVREAVLDLLRSELKQFLREDRTYTATYAIFGGLGSGSSIEDILQSLLKAAIVETPQRAAKAFFSEVSGGYLPYQEYFLLTGVKVENEVQVFSGVSLVALSNKGDELPGHLPVLIGRDSIDFLSKTLLRVDMSVSPVLQRPEEGYTLQSGPDRHFQTAVRSVEEPNFHPGKFFQALTLIGGNPVLSAMRWTHMSDEHIFDLRIGPGSGYSASSTEASSTALSETQIREAASLYRKITGLPQDVEKALQVPIDRWMKSKTHQGSVDKMIDLGIAMESFYLRGIRGELSFRFRLRGSLHLGGDMEERKQLKKEFGQIYKYRSGAVHEGTLPERVNVDEQSIPIGRYIERSQELFRRSLMKVIQSGVLPDWEDIELGVGVGTEDPAADLDATSIDWGGAEYLTK